VAYSPFSEKFSPFFADTQYDVDAVNMTQISMLTTDRMGGIIYNAIDGEKVNYNGTDYEYKGPCNVTVSYDQSADVTTYTVKLKEGIKFSDGTEATADDMLFTYYVYLDPDYVGSTTLSSYDIIGLRNYQTQRPTTSTTSTTPCSRTSMPRAPTTPSRAASPSPRSSTICSGRPCCPRPGSLRSRALSIMSTTTTSAITGSPRCRA
jgi:peptide/nickel transport system substrate-binding protein